MPKDDSYHVGVLDRAVKVLKAVAQEPMSAWEIADHLGLEHSTVYRLIRSMEGYGLLNRMPGKRYTIGFTVVDLARSATSHGVQWQAAHTQLVELSLETHETVFLSVREGLDLVCIDRVSSQQGIRFSVDIGNRQPLNAGAAGKLMLSHAGDELFDALVARGLRGVTGTTITDPADLRKELDQIRETGIALSRGENTPGAASIAAPIRTPAQEVIAALSVGGPEERLLGDGRADELTDLVTRYARIVAERLFGGV